MQFPRPSIVDQLANKGLLENALDIMAQRLTADITQGSIGYCEKFVQEYIRQAESNPQVAAAVDLRKAVYILVFEYGILLNPSMEIVWDIVAVYGPQNSRKTIDFVNQLPPIYKPKFAKYLLHVAQEPVPLDQLRKVLYVFFSTSFSEAIDQELLKTIKALKTDQARAITGFAKSHMASASAHTLVTLFPDLKIRRANELLQKSTLEEVTQRLLQDPALISEAPKTKPRYVLLDKTSRSQINVKRRTLQMALEYLDEDPDDTMEYGTEAQTLSTADRRLVEQDKMLYQAFSSSPQLFEKSARKTKERDQLRKKFDWTDEQLEGWAVMVKRDPKRQSKLAWTADFGRKEESSQSPKPPAKEKSATPDPKPAPVPASANRKPKPKARYKQHHKDKPLKE